MKSLLRQLALIALAAIFAAATSRPAAPVNANPHPTIAPAASLTTAPGLTPNGVCDVPLFQAEFRHQETFAAVQAQRVSRVLLTITTPQALPRGGLDDA